MRVYFIGIGGTAIGPLALIAKQAGYQVAGSDKQNSAYIDYLKSQGIGDVNIGSDDKYISSLHSGSPIDLVVFSSAVSIENPNHPELKFARENGIKTSKRDELLVKIINDNNLKLIAVAGTHGKTTTTAMVVWLFKQLNIPVSYSVGAKISFGDMGNFDKSSEYFIYEADEFDRNFLAFHPYLSTITGIDYDHQEQYPTVENYQQAFAQFLSQSEHKILWQEDVAKLKLQIDDSFVVFKKSETILNTLSVAGTVNRQDSWQSVQTIHKLTKIPVEELIKHIEDFPGVSRRFERITDNLYSDYAHTIPKIKGCLQMASEVSKNLVVIYEPLTNRRQYFIRDEYKTLFKDVKKLYWVPSYLAREDAKQKVITPQEFITSIDKPDDKEATELNEVLKQNIVNHLNSGDSVVCLSGGGGGSLDEWIRQEFK